MRPVYVVGAGAVSPLGSDWRAWPDAVDVADDFDVAGLPAPRDQAEARARMLMSRPALLAAVAMANTLADADWSADQRREAACFMGVGASGGDISQLERILAATLREDGFSQQRLCGRGVRACSPLFTFQLMNNFTLCHGAILEGVAGPNGAFYSRGVGTVRALREAWWALEEGDAQWALAGGADDALYPVTRDELRRAGVLDGVVPGAGAALVALSAEPPRSGAATLTACVAWDTWPDDAELDAALGGRWPWSHVVLAPSDRGAALRLAACVDTRCPGARTFDVSALFGEALAATPSLAWVYALAQRAKGGGAGVGVLTAGVDGGLGVVAFGD